ncbi:MULTISPECIES: ATP-binding protein [unclassified Dehalobacter]|uniref:sensor histidine kinase n=1 Tax=unclassified Dehalobacter TaxID=2635733 RepID=UPI000E6C2DED|nr:MULTISPECIES: ATP-binding protein [unclassified Dehalobacter]RJE47532.1 histidine kinase [Dehalobacter sp. MCB1]TCX48657.1 ATP-binding protein [Dehalobacter sp. 14DCB1]TCX56295.1 ATP-binding protein [Dehalobacter sp. 12DCB1]
MNQYPKKRTIPGVLSALRETQDDNLTSYYENTMVSMYMSVLLFLAAFISFFPRYFYLASDWQAYFVDSLVLLALALGFNVVPKLDFAMRYATWMISGLTALTLLFLTVRMYDLIGPALYTFAYLQLILAMIRVTRVMMVTTTVAILFSVCYVLFHSYHVQFYQMTTLSYVSQLILFMVLVVVMAAVNNVSIGRYRRLEKQLQEAICQNEKITGLFKQNVASDEELKTTISRLKKTQEQLVQQEKLAAIGQLAAGVAHEINNPLGYISSNFETSRLYFDQYTNMINAYHSFLEQLCPSEKNLLASQIENLRKLEETNNLKYISTDLEDLFFDIEDGLKRISEIVTGLKTFSRADQGNEFEDYDLNNGLKNTLLVARNEIKHHARVIELFGELPLIQAKGNQINQVLLNIILNAVYAIKTKEPETLGSIMVSTAVADDFVRCQIEDNGTGINKENLREIFNPFFTTKPVGQGTGLGLSIAYDIVVNTHGGQISVQSTPGISTRFIILLPVRQQPEANTGEENE